MARLLYGFRVSIWFALALTFVGTVLGVAAGALQGYFGGRVDLFSQRLMEIWGAIPELYLLIIFASIFEPSLLLLLVLLSLWGWMGLSDYVRAEFLRNRGLEYVKAARALGLSNAQIIWRHVLPNSMTPVITFLPFRMSVAILADGVASSAGVPTPCRRCASWQGARRTSTRVDHRPTFGCWVTSGLRPSSARAARARHAQVVTAPLLDIDRLTVRSAGTSSTTCRFSDRAGLEIRAGRRMGRASIPAVVLRLAPPRADDGRSSSTATTDPAASAKCAASACQIATISMSR